MARKKHAKDRKETRPAPSPPGSEGAGPRALRPRRAALLLFLLGLAGAGIWGVVWTMRSGDGAAGAQFVGVAACASCHAEEYGAWSGSHHDRAMQEAREATVLGDFSGTTLSDAGRTATFLRRDGKFLVRTEGADGRMGEFEVRYTFGVEPLQQYLVELPGGRVQPLPFAWDSRPKQQGGERWFHLYPGQGIEHTDELHWTGRLQNWNFTCADCHSTGLRKGYDAAADRFQTTWSEIDVSCEACHGPGSRHTRWARTPGLVRSLLWRDDGLPLQLTERRGVSWTHDASTGQPERSAPRATDREIEMCAQCHSRRAQVADGYTAGASMHDYYTPSLLMPGLYYADGQQRDEVYNYGSFLQSRMYHAGVTCSDCHEPHSQKLRAPGNQVCAQCHTAPRYDSPRHHFHPAGSQGAQCTSCHMPATTYMVVDPRLDHSIRIPRPDQSVSLGVPNACNGCHADRSAAWAAERVRGWYGRDPVGFQRFAEAFHADESGAPGAAEALGRLTADRSEPAIVRASALARLAGRPGQTALQAARAGVSDPDPLVRRAALLILETIPPQERVGLAAPLLGDPARSVRTQAAWVLAPASASLALSEQGEAFERAAAEFVEGQRFNADRAESRLTLGSFFAQLGRAAEAAEEYRAALRLAPRLVATYVNLADLLRTQGAEPEAERTLREGLAALPDDATLHHALALSLARSGRLPQAVAELRRAASLAPDDPGIAYAYAVALHSTGRPAEAVRVLEQALARHPDDRQLLFALATFHRDAGQGAAALRYAEMLARTHPDDAEARALLQSLQPPPGR